MLAFLSCVNWVLLKVYKIKKKKWQEKVKSFIAKHKIYSPLSSVMYIIIMMNYIIFRNATLDANILIFNSLLKTFIKVLNIQYSLS